VVSAATVRIASRGSQLALWQAEAVRASLLEAHPGLRVEIEIIRTTGDRILDVPLARIGDRGLFTKEIDEALLDGRADIAVHSLKDVPTRIPAGLTLAAIGEREDPRDVLIAREGVPPSLAALPAGARVGTSSLRRRSQLRHVRPDLEVTDLRGNLNTRLAKLDEGAYEAILLAAAGVLRLGWKERISESLPVEEWVPAVGQGALAIVGREGEEETLSLLRALHHPITAACVTAERTFLRALEGGCQVPIGALATMDGDELRIDGFVADIDGSIVLRDATSGPSADAARIGLELSARLQARGATEILERIRAESSAPGVPAP
jgi:hydroxymethylbilane synthase